MNTTGRNLTWALSTLTVVVLLFGYKTSTGGSLTGASSVISAAPVSGTSGTVEGAPETDSGSASTDSTGSDSTGSDSSGSDSSTTQAGTVTGDEAQTQWGPVQVAVSVADGKVTDVQVVEYPDNNPRDAEINSYALPILVDETIDAQSADIDMVSGATVTSEGYVESLQSALDRAGL